MSSRDTILRSIRSHTIEPTPLPTLDQDWITFDDPIQHFTTVLESVGGQCRQVANLAEVQTALDSMEQFASASVRYSAIPDVGSPTLHDNEIDDPHLLETVDFAVLAGSFAVAENGAVWVTDQNLKHRVPYFLSQHLALVVPASEVVHNLHQAYRRPELKFESARFGAFISGPSKTADIEQSLVIGAHGPRSHIVFLVANQQDRTSSLLH
jgi:L-lactate dehydrogenase complex protein LldG